jgi:hypothetical protein
MWDNKSDIFTAGNRQAKQIEKVCDKLYNKYGYKSFDEI